MERLWLTIGSHQGTLHIRGITAGADRVCSAEPDEEDEWQGADGVLRRKSDDKDMYTGVLTARRKTSILVASCTSSATRPSTLSSTT
jgi:hypothetical protein